MPRFAEPLLLVRELLGEGLVVSLLGLLLRFTFFERILPIRFRLRPLLGHVGLPAFRRK